MEADCICTGVCLGIGRTGIEGIRGEEEGSEGSKRYLRVQTFEAGMNIVEEYTVGGCIPGPMTEGRERVEDGRVVKDAFHGSTRQTTGEQSNESSGAAQHGALRAIGGEASGRGAQGGEARYECMECTARRMRAAQRRRGRVRLGRHIFKRDGEQSRYGAWRPSPLSR